MRLALILSSTVILVTVVWWARHSQSAAESASTAAVIPADDRGELARLRREVLAMRAEAAEMAQFVGRANAHQGTSQQQVVTSVNAPSREPDDEDAFDEYVTALDDHFSTEVVDPTWTARADLTGKLAEILPTGSRVRSLDCRSTMCRLETAHADDRRYREFSANFMLQVDAPPIWSGPSVFQIVHPPEREGDELIAVALLARESFPPSVSP